ncbi:MAG TPA: DUF1800 domain-containing protein [Bacteroidota bacterium]|nr:DUF1800 domain-containing protein [Bacteroidota bacterium]
MERRSLFSTLAGPLLDAVAPEPAAADPGDNPFANKQLPKVQRTTAGLEQYTGTFGTAEALHLLRRTMFGPAPADVKNAVANGLTTTLNALFATPTDEPSQPLIYDARDTVAAVGQTWVNGVYEATGATTNPVGLRTTSLKSWWMDLIVNQKLSIREKMVLFWHNHYSTEVSTVGDPRFSYYYLALLRSNALGNFKSLTTQISIDGAMLRYLNGNTNTKKAPNENYGRELQELFTIGKGPEVSPGDYTYYTEADVQAAAHVLTGWKDFQNADGTVGPSPTSTFVATNHDPTNKQFSARYQNTVITGGSTAADGPRELGALMDMIFAQSETARSLCRELYRWFVYYVIDDTTEANVIGPMADLVRSNNYDILPALKTLIGSAHFFDPVNRGCMIKSPIDHLAGIFRLFSILLPTDIAQRYSMLNYITSTATAMDQNPGDPPNVAGWEAYYQTPEFYELWINTDTLPKRGNASALLAGRGYSNGISKVAIDPIRFVQTTISNPNDPNIIVSESAQLLMAIDLTDTQIAFLKNTLLPGLPDYEWTSEWTTYLADPSNSTKINAVKNKLTALYSFMMSMPEFQLL